MTDQEKTVLEQFIGAYDNMRKYQKSFFGGNKAALKNAIYWENQTDNFAKKVEIDFKLKVVRAKGESTQGRMI